METFSKPTNDQVDTVARKLASPHHEWYFFDRLNNPHWIGPLKERGFFKHPPGAERLDDGGVQSIPWPESRYLSRMASLAPGDVAEIFAAIETDNLLIIHDLQQAAQAMPPEIAALLVPAVCSAIDTGRADFKNASDLCAKLASTGQTDAALELANSLFAIKIPEGSEEPQRHGSYWYREGLQIVAPILTSSRPVDFLPILCGWLRDAVKAKKPWNEQHDFSGIWRPAIEEHEQNDLHDFAGTLVALVRQSFEEAVTNNRISQTESLAILQRERYTVFRRLSIHLINVFADRDPALARATMMDRSLFNDHEYKHEYAMLVGRRYPMLTASERDEWLAWIDEGPDLSRFDALFKTAAGKEPTEGDRIKQKRYWQFERLHWIRERLEGERKVFYAQMLADYGEPRLADLNSRRSSGHGTTSPIKINELQSLPFAEAVRKVATWRANDPQTVAPDLLEALTGTFRQYIETSPEEFSKQATEMRGIPLPLVRIFIEQMSNAVKDGKAIDISVVFALCEWVVNQPLELRPPTTEGRETAVQLYQRCTRESVSRFIETVCKARINDRPRYPREELRGRFAAVLTQLMRDPDLSNIIDDDRQEDPRLLEYFQHALNSSRGRAVGAILDYAHWIAEHIQQAKDGREIVPGGFTAMQEVKQMLEWNIENPSYAASAMIGSRIGLLYWIDERWLSEHAARIFNLEKHQINPIDASGWVAWNTFLVWVQPFIEYYQIFRSQYSQAIAQISSMKPRDASYREPVRRLGEHLIILYGRGQLSLDDDEQLVQRFFSQASPEIRVHIIEFMANTLRREAPLGGDVIKRFQSLWDFYWPKYGRQDSTHKAKNRIGSWFESKEFPTEWYLQRLQEFVEIATSADLDRAVVDRLAEIASNDIAHATAILNLMLPAAEGSWRLWSWHEPAKTILQVAMTADEPTRKLARQVINRLGRRGLTDFGDLLLNQI